MANLMDLLQNQVSEGLLDQLTSQIGGSDKTQTKTAVDGIMSTLMHAVAKNASTPEGAKSLAGALDRDHDGSILDDVMGFMSGNSQPQNTKMVNGAGILKHVLGGSQNGAIDMIAKMSGLDKSKTGQLLVSMAPMVMGVLGKAKKENNLDIGGLTDFLSNSNQNHAQNNSNAGLITQLLDRDGDGSVVDDVAGFGIKALFGKLFKK